MWLKINFENGPTLLAAVGTDGRLYFVAKDVAAFLGYSNKMGFAKRHATRDLSRVVPPEYAVYMKKGHGPAFLFPEMIDKICLTGSHHSTPIEEIARIRDLYEEGWVFDGRIPDPMPFCPKLAHSVYVEARGSEMKFGRWLNDYATRTLNCYQFEKRVLVAPPSVESHFEEESIKKEECFSNVIRAEGAWVVNETAEVFAKALDLMKRKFEEMEKAEAEEYELEVKMTRKLKT